MKNMAWKLVPGFFNFQGMLCKKESEEISWQIWANFDNFPKIVKSGNHSALLHKIQFSTELSASPSKLFTLCSIIVLIFPFLFCR